MQWDHDNKTSMWCDKNPSGLIRWGLHIKILLDEEKKQNTIMSFPFLAVSCSEEIQCCVDWERCRCHLCGFSLLVFVCISPALHCSRFVCKALKASCSHAMRSLLIKELLQHMGRDISSHACQTYWILSFFISVNNKPRQTQIQLHQRGEVKCDEMVCVSTQVDMGTGVWGLYYWGLVWNTYFVMLHDWLTSVEQKRWFSF